MNRREFILTSTTGLAAAALTMSGSAAQADEKPKPSPVDADLRKRLLDYLEDINRWILTLDVGSGKLKNTKDTSTSIFINGNLARVLLASHRITGSRAHLAETLRWCDTFCKQQQKTKSSTGKDAGYWPDCGPTGNIYFGDAGTAATALAIACRFADSDRQQVYREAMDQYVRFVTEGCKQDPQSQGRKSATTWVIKEGPDAGALGCGYYRGKLSLEPYTISTATTGGAFFSELFAITGNPEHKRVAADATRWLLEIRKADGELPYTLAGKTLNSWPLDTLSYCTEAFVAADLHLKDPELRARLLDRLEPTVRWYLGRQNPDGSWGKLRSADQQRSPRSLTLLSWWHDRVEPTPEISGAIRKYCGFLLNPSHGKAYGVKELLRTSGFVGLAIAELIKPCSTF
ncbi:MAG: hypothetical protein JXQ73_30260 [Phycisphaerae bacterium]|nr:hypothetical protein [Phycisphaerae bacterium]